jgi:hypothetical protein
MRSYQQAVRYAVAGLLLASPVGCSTPAKTEAVLSQGEASPEQQPKAAPSQLASDAVKEPAPRDTQPVPTDEAASAPQAVVPGSLRLVFIADHELLKSEVRTLRALKKDLQKLGDMVHEATLDEELTYLEATENANAPRLPAGWQPVEKIVLVQLRAPVTNQNGKRATGGLKSLMVVMPPLNNPVYKDESSFKPKQIAAVVDALSVAKEAK